MVVLKKSNAHVITINYISVPSVKSQKSRLRQISKVITCLGSWNCKNVIGCFGHKIVFKINGQSIFPITEGSFYICDLSKILILN